MDQILADAVVIAGEKTKKRAAGVTTGGPGLQVPASADQNFMRNPTRYVLPKVS